MRRICLWVFGLIALSLTLPAGSSMGPSDQMAHGPFMEPSGYQMAHGPCMEPSGYQMAHGPLMEPNGYQIA